MAQSTKTVPVLPKGCESQISSNGLYCSARVVTGDKATVTFAAVVSRDSFPTVDSILDRYTNFARWSEYAKTSPNTVIEFKQGGSVALEPITNAAGVETLRHVYDYSLKIQGIPLLKQSVRGITYNTIVTPYSGALASLEFAAQTAPVPGFQEKPKGLKSQTGSIHAVVCDPTVLEVCDDSKWLLVYETTVQPDVSFAMNIAANTVTAGIEDLLVGMLDESITN